jgi:hypothetical protein
LVGNEYDRNRKLTRRLTKARSPDFAQVHDEPREDRITGDGLRVL